LPNSIKPDIGSIFESQPSVASQIDFSEKDQDIKTKPLARWRQDGGYASTKLTLVRAASNSERRTPERVRQEPHQSVFADNNERQNLLNNCTRRR
jgi:hypothetical protein